MNTRAEKTKENKKQPVSASSFQIQSGGEPTFQFVDNRPETIAQRKLQEMVNNSPQAKQAAQLQAMAGNHSSKQQKPIQKKENNTGLPDNLKSGIENLSGYSMDDVNVHYNSDKPAQLNAHAYAQGTNIHLASGQEKHLPHEAWHVVQQKQGRVKPTMQMQSKLNINDDAGLEKEADVMGAKAISIHDNLQISYMNYDGSNRDTSQIIQRVPFKLAERRFNELISEEKRIDLIVEEGNDLENEYWDNEENEKLKIKYENDFKEFWHKYTFIEYPKEFQRALEIWQQVVEAPLNHLFDDLKTITQLPRDLSKDTIILNIGQRLNNLKAILEQKNLPVTGEGFKDYIIEQMIHFSGIRQRLLSEPEVLSELWGGDPKRMQIVFESLGADEHGYATPTKLGISDGKEYKSLVYKSRIGEVDKLVTDLFQAINDLQLAEEKLPAYKQAIFRDKHLLSEFIQGHAVDSKISLMSGAGNALDTLGKLVPEPQLLAKNVLLLEAVAKQIGLTDLHEENLILNPNTNQVVPIDLEAFSFGKKQETGLYGHNKAPDVREKVPKEAVPLITDFGERLEKIERRFVPVPTGVLYNSLNQQDGVKTVFSLIRESFISNGLQVNEAELEKYVQNCKANRPMAIPAFTLKEGRVLSSALGQDSQLIVAINHRK